ncbi:predicted protein [Naegleria gruberi]|uniref:Predicted protein n=1 Tax=Naegleria gruberi TaxID=5762 RepID=D2V842_NAEGR|nr:uncharacterized protein NAEGRDRAFT_65022 [Naegleria gruberi]EFC47113.1 predicted protein [Naegleria gruberi]|eukprot:XP_002679857.1 predicted protein [Naegleria gruberi strain NEG-M]
MVEIKNPSSSTTITPKIADTVQEVKENIQENIVNVTVDNKAIDQTIEGLKSLTKGEIPSNEQLLSGVEQVKDIVDKSSQYVTSSQNIQERAIHLLDIVKQLIEEKNKDQVLQQFIYNTNMFIDKYSDKVVHVVKDTTSDVNDQLNQETKSFYESVQNFSNFIFELFRSNSFRLLMVDTLNYLRVLSNKSLTNIHLKEKVKDQMDVTEDTPKNKSDWEKPFLESSSVESSSKKQKTKVVAASVEPTKSDVKSAELKQEKLEDQIYDRFSELIKEFSSNRSYRKAVLGFSNMFDQLKFIFNDNIESNVNDLVKEMQNDKYFINMKENGEKLLIQWVGNEKIIKDMEQSLQDIYKAFSNDKELSKLLDQVEKDTHLDIHYVDENVEYELKGLRMNASDLLPSHVKMSGHSVTDIDYSEDKLADSLQGTQSTLVLHLSGIVFHFKDVQFWFKRFSFPQLSDEGLLNIDTGDDGVMIHLKINVDTSTNELGDTEWFKYNSITVDIDDLKLKFTHAEHHEILLRVLSGYIQNNVRRRLKDQLQDMLQNYMVDGLQRLNHLLEQSSENINRLGDQWAQSSGIRELVSGGEGITDTVSRVVSNQLAGFEEL